MQIKIPVIKKKMKIPLLVMNDNAGQFFYATRVFTDYFLDFDVFCYLLALENKVLTCFLLCSIIHAFIRK